MPTWPVGRNPSRRTLQPYSLASMRPAWMWRVNNKAGIGNGNSEPQLFNSSSQWPVSTAYHIAATWGWSWDENPSPNGFAGFPITAISKSSHTVRLLKGIGQAGGNFLQTKPQSQRAKAKTPQTCVTHPLHAHIWASIHPFVKPRTPLQAPQPLSCGGG